MLAQSSRAEEPISSVTFLNPPAPSTTNYSTTPPPCLNPNLPGSTLQHPKKPSTLLFARFTGVTGANKELADRVCEKARDHMSKYDNSHNWEHIQHVVANADLIYSKELERETEWVKQCDPLIILLGCVLHDVDDHKYDEKEEKKKQQQQQEQNLKTTSEEDKNWIMHYLLTSAVPLPLATTIDTIARAVSFSTQRADPTHISTLLATYPELRIVQDADRVETLGARGQGRCFAYHGANKDFQMDSIQRAVQHHWEKLCLLPGMMNTATGREMGEDGWRWMCEFRERWDWETRRLGRVC
ncbi:hypothetical protein BDV96DRAFT_487580 [Lophiotrema nucula]|uniref:HD/PDEase domain-containing protein n=1 Tax=Lophiotrema nucula TaxID=690887 RepID=A0A6A5ZGQ1_9PLEO|nr:hypothetical protein BDV96DRAFT_487580 [Lophiotrema nucula]